MNEEQPHESALKISLADVEHLVGEEEGAVFDFLVPLGFFNDQPFNDYAFRFRNDDTKQIVSGSINMTEQSDGTIACIVASIGVYDPQKEKGAGTESTGITLEKIIQHFYDLDKITK